MREPDQLAEQNLFLIPQIMGETKSQWRGLDPDEVRDAAFEGLDNATLTYNRKKHASFKSWAASKIRWAILDYVRSKSKRPEVKAAPLPEPGKADGQFKPGIKLSAPVDVEAICKCCHHPFYMHHPAMGCQHWDMRRLGSGYCDCEGFCAELPAYMRTRE